MTNKLFIPHNPHRDDDYLDGIEDFGEKIGGARKDFYASIKKDFSEGKINFAKLEKAGIRKDVILLADYGKFFDVDYDRILNLIKANNDEGIQEFIKYLVEAKYSCMSSYCVIDEPLINIMRRHIDLFLDLARKNIRLFRYKGAFGASILIYSPTRGKYGKEYLTMPIRDADYENVVSRNESYIVEKAQEALGKPRVTKSKEEREEEKAEQEKWNLKYFTVYQTDNGANDILCAQLVAKEGRYYYCGRDLIPLITTKHDAKTFDALYECTSKDSDRYGELLSQFNAIIQKLPPHSNKVLIWLGKRSILYKTGEKADWQVYKKFDQEDEVIKYLCNNFVEVYTDIYNIVEGQKLPPYEENVGSCAYRKGPNWLKGRDATQDDFLKVFGFRGVEFGNYVTQKERQPLMNKAYNALRDMCNVLALPTRVVGLGGRLGLAFGARGRGGKGAPAAHYEPYYNVINLTRPHGAGSLAHEWFHALDHNIGSNKDLFLSFNHKNGKLGEYFTNVSDFDRYEDYRDAYYDKNHLFLPLLNDIEFDKDSFPWYQRSQLLQTNTNNKKQNGVPYWTCPTEMGARSFEAFINAKLHRRGWDNEFLANLHYPHKYYPYPVFYEHDGMKADDFGRLELLEDFYSRLLNPALLTAALGEEFKETPTITDTPTIETTDNSPVRKQGEEEQEEEEEETTDESKEEEVKEEETAIKEEEGETPKHDPSWDGCEVLKTAERHDGLIFSRTYGFSPSGNIIHTSDADIHFFVGGCHGGFGAVPIELEYGSKGGIFETKRIYEKAFSKKLSDILSKLSPKDWSVLFGVHKNNIEYLHNVYVYSNNLYKEIRWIKSIPLKKFFDWESALIYLYKFFPELYNHVYNIEVLGKDPKDLPPLPETENEEKRSRAKILRLQLKLKMALNW